MSRSKTSVTVHSASGLRNTQTFGKQDPFIKITAGRTSRQTRTYNDGGKSGYWDQKLDFVGSVRSFQVQAWNENTMSNTLIGECRVQRCNKGMQIPLQLEHKGKPAGTVTVSFDWIEGAQDSGSLGGRSSSSNLKANVMATMAFGSANAVVGNIGGDILKQSMNGDEVTVKLTPAQVQATKRVSFDGKDNLMAFPDSTPAPEPEAPIPVAAAPVAPPNDGGAVWADHKGNEWAAPAPAPEAPIPVVAAPVAPSNDGGAVWADDKDNEEVWAKKVAEKKAKQEAQQQEALRQQQEYQRQQEEVARQQQELARKQEEARIQAQMAREAEMERRRAAFAAAQQKAAEDARAAEAARRAALAKQEADAKAQREAFLAAEEARRREEAQRAQAAQRAASQPSAPPIPSGGGGMVSQIGGSFNGGYPGMVGGAYPGMVGGAYPGMVGGAYPGMVGGGYPGMVGGGYPGMVGGGAQGGILAGALGRGPVQRQQFAPVNQPNQFVQAPQYQVQHQQQFQPVQPQSQLMAVQCPQGIYPGQAIRIRAPNGQLLQVNVPQGISPGQTFHVRC
jgi:chemotaxis protein histidine kinase CheA